MALDSKKLTEVNKLLREIEQSYSKLGQKNPFSKDPEEIAKSAKEVKKLEDALAGVQKKVNDLEEGFGGITSAIGASLAEMSKTDSASNRTMKAMRGIRNITSDLANDQAGLTRLSLKELKTKQDRLKSLSKEAKEQAEIASSQYKTFLVDKNGNQLQGAALVTKRKYLLENDKEFQKISEIYAAHEDGLGILDEAIKKTSKRISHEEKINKQLGIAGGLLKGLSKIPILGDVFNADEALRAMRDNIENSKSPVAALGAGFKNIGNQIREGMLNPANMVLAAFTFIVDLFRTIDKQSGEYAKNMNLTYSESLKVREEMSSIATFSGDAALNASRLLETQTQVGKALGTNARLNEDDLKTMTKLVNQSGLQHNELMGIQKLSLVNGKTLKQNTKEIFGGAKAYAARNKIVVNEKEVLKEVNKSSKALQLSLGQNLSEVSKAVVKAKQFGLNLEEAERIASSLLDFESSITAELEAELLTGKNLNFEKARQLSLEGNIAGAAAEVASQMGSAADFGKMNVIQQEAIAKSIGMSREDLAKSLIEKEALAKIGVKDVEEARKKYDALVQQYGVEEAQKRLGDEELAKQYEQQSNAEKFAQAVEKIKDIFTTIIDGPLGTILNMFSTLLDNAGVLYGITGAIAGVYAGKMVAGIAKTIAKLGVMLTLNTANAAASTASATAVSFGAMVPVILGAVAAIGGAIYGFTKGNDIMSPGDNSPGYGKRTLFGPEGAIQLNDKDTVIAGTDLFGGDKKRETPSPQQQQPQQASVDMTQTNALLQQLINVIQTGGQVILDGEKVGQALKLGTYQVQ